ncbi:hypothetical protein [Geminicoccus harenae]|uniref:hypothetical protein n=1 Tax=Geminicoccus harenae TaxID=2498453 RepID=UPI00168AD966|nr:hypothetical protein [Geminicoccus harenae]
MMRWLTALVLLAGAFLARPAAAEITELAKVGPWDAFHVINDDGHSLCGISQFNNGLGFLIKVDNERQAFIHLSKEGWAVPAGARVRVGFVVDGRPVLDLPFLPTDHPTMIEGNLVPEQAAGLIDRFSLGGHMQVRFLTGNEGFWDVPLEGTYRITQHFLRCLAERLHPRQPFDAALPGSSQPF